MKEPKKGMPKSVFSFLVEFFCIFAGSIILNILINTSNNYENKTFITIFFSFVALISLVGIICTIVFWKKGDNKK